MPLNTQKNDSIDDLKEQNKTLKMEIEKVNDLKAEIDRLDKANDENTRKYWTTYQAETKLIRKNKELTKEIESYQHKLDRTEDALFSLRRNIAIITVALGSFALLKHFKMI